MSVMIEKFLCKMRKRKNRWLIRIIKYTLFRKKYLYYIPVYNINKKLLKYQNR